MHRTFVFGSAVFFALAGGCGGSLAQSSSDAEAIKAANTGFYTALSARDAGQLDRVWDHAGQVFNIFAVSKTPMVGWNAVKSGYEDLFNRFAELSVSMADPSIRQDGDSAVVVGVETQRVRPPSGEIASAQLPATCTNRPPVGHRIMRHRPAPRRSVSKLSEPLLPPQSSERYSARAPTPRRLPHVLQFGIAWLGEGRYASRGGQLRATVARPTRFSELLLARWRTRRAHQHPSV
jgi:ketosteroid isomerase-like protein